MGIKGLSCEIPRRSEAELPRSRPITGRYGLRSMIFQAPSLDSEITMVPRIGMPAPLDPGIETECLSINWYVRWTPGPWLSEASSLIEIRVSGPSSAIGIILERSDLSTKVLATAICWRASAWKKERIVASGVINSRFELDFGLLPQAATVISITSKIA